MIDPAEQASESRHVLRALARATIIPASSMRPDTVAAIFAALSSSRSMSLARGRAILSLRSTGPAIGLSEREANADLIPDLSDLPLQDVPNAERIADFDRIQVGTANGED